MTRNFVSRALMIAGLVVASATVGFAQNVPVESRVRRVAPGHESAQPVAVSTAITSTSGAAGTSAAALNLSADQRAKIDAMNTEVSALHAERAKLWKEYRAITSAPNYSDEIAANQAAPRMRRIVEINAQLAPIVARQESQIAALLTPAQRNAVMQMVTSVKAGL